VKIYDKFNDGEQPVTRLRALAKQLCLAPLDLLSAYWPFNARNTAGDKGTEAARMNPYRSDADNFGQHSWSGAEKQGYGNSDASSLPDTVGVPTDVGGDFSGGGE
tara:strand:- start:3035 stop:3349 length:315 start_codon:yes stop_codon:yes gene_type:complete